MPGFPAAYFFIVGICIRATCIAGDRVTYTDQALEYNLCMPKTTFSKSGNCFFRGRFLINARKDLRLTVLWLCTTCKNDNRNECSNDCFHDMKFYCFEFVGGFPPSGTKTRAAEFKQ